VVATNPANEGSDFLRGRLDVVALQDPQTLGAAIGTPLVPSSPSTRGAGPTPPCAHKHRRAFTCVLQARNISELEQYVGIHPQPKAKESPPMMNRFSLLAAFDTDGAAQATRALMAQLDEAPADRFSAEPSRHPDDQVDNAA
jgi:hypothetical protein